MNDHIAVDIEVLQQRSDYHKKLSDTWYQLFNSDIRDITIVVGTTLIDMVNMNAKPEATAIAREFMQKMYEYHRSEFETLDNKIIELHHLIAGTMDTSAAQ